MDRSVEKLLYSRRDTAEALSLSIRSIDYLITTGRLTAWRVGGKILIPASAVRRFAREDHPDSARSGSPLSSSGQMKVSQHSSEGSMIRFPPQSQGIDETVPERANSLH
jgi:excisionase family DNA binding protein